MLLQNAQVLGEDFTFFHGNVRVENGKITEVGKLSPRAEEEVLALDGRYLIPGLIESHFHGAMGLDCSLGRRDVFEAYAAFFVTRGITGFVPALISSNESVTQAYLTAGRAYMETPMEGARMLGMYLEGPFLNPAYKGAHDSAVLQAPSVDKLRAWQKLAGGNIIKLLVAPELSGAEELIQYAVAEGMTVEMGHSGATAEQAKTALDWGVTLVTHAYNAMPSLHHRNPGILGVALTDSRVRCELIGDMLHVAPEAARLVWLAKGEEGVNLISDSHEATGLPEGNFVGPDGRPVTVSGGLARLADGTILGGTSTVLDCVRRMVSCCGVPLEKAVKLGSFNPARTLGLTDRGCIAPGMLADMAVLDEKLNLCRTIVGGKTVYKGE